ncbi:nucleotide exchange factor GrpE [Saccharomonospora sp. NB11]|uniref:nucleotide exchange factor GrpE n=1 Tax=Saccharomonospora sp. NB11 TaxID=1642298 RepID=UPI0018D02037|nr:nucleotide exchange factor GrpE [Saccharomonospora sp. NB11]
MTESQSERADEREQEPVVVRDRRKIDPETGELRAQDGAQTDAEEAQEVPADSAAPAQADAAEGTAGEGVTGPDVSELEKQLDERTADLKRVQAEYANYRRRVEREREAMTEGGKAAVVGDLLPLLDDLERADAHGDLTGAFKAVAEKLLATLEKAGLEPFAAVGDEFDPTVHEAVQHDTSPDVDGPTVTTVLRRGYRFGDRVLRAALVGVTDHEPAPQPSGDAEEAIDQPVNGELPVDKADETER